MSEQRIVRAELDFMIQRVIRRTTEALKSSPPSERLSTIVFVRLCLEDLDKVLDEAEAEEESA